MLVRSLVTINFGFRFETDSDSVTEKIFDGIRLKDDWIPGRK